METKYETRIYLLVCLITAVKLKKYQSDIICKEEKNPTLMSTSQSNWSGWFQLLSPSLLSFYYVTISVTSRFFWKFCTVIPQLWSLVPFFGRQFVPAFESGRLEQPSTFLAYWYWYQNSVTFRPAAATIWLSHLASPKSTDDEMRHGGTSTWNYQDYFKEVHICLNSNFEF